MIRRLFGRRNNRRAVEIAADAWNKTTGEDWDGRARVAKNIAEDGCRSVFSTLLVKIAIHIAIKLIEKWAEEHLFSATEEDISNAC